MSYGSAQGATLGRHRACRPILAKKSFAPGGTGLSRRWPSSCVMACGRHPFGCKARSPQVRTLSFAARPPDLRRLSLGHRGFAVVCPLAPLGVASYPVLVHRPAAYAPGFLPTLGRPHAVAVCFALDGLITGGLAPPGQRPCWAHNEKPPGHPPRGDSCSGEISRSAA